MRSPALPGAIIACIAFILLLVCTVSTPIWKPVYFLKADVAVSSLGTTLSGSARFGVWGYCLGGRTDSLIYADSTTASCSPIKLGYNFDPKLLGVNVLKGSKADKIMPALTGALVLVVVSCGLTFFALVTSLFAVFCNSRFWEIMSFLWCIVAALITWISFIINIIVFSLARKRLASYTNNELRASYGPALWIQLTAAIILLVATIITCFGACGSYRARRRERSMGTSPYATDKTVVGGERRKWYQRRGASGTGTY